jgi:hypothetical protein
MSGPGSEQQAQPEKRLVENCPAIDINWLMRVGAVDGRARDVSWERRGRKATSATLRLSGGKLIIMMVTSDGDQGRRSLELQEVETTATPCNYGGERLWLVCPGRVEELQELGAYNTLGDGGSCGRRVGKLYRLPEGKRFLCRDCLNLTYLSTRVSKDVRLARRTLAIRRRLGQPDPGQPFPPRPRGMHHQTYRRLQAECLALDTVGMYLTMKRFGLITPDMQALLDGKVD